MKKDVEELVLLGKNAIVEMALELIDTDVSAENFSKIKVITNGETVQVLFLNPIKYLPLNSASYFDFNVDVLKKIVSYHPSSNGNFSEEKNILPFYQSKETDINIDFVLNAINVSNEIGAINILNFEDEMFIREKDNYYEITLISEFQESTYKITKETGKVFDLEHATLLPPPSWENEDVQEYIEVN
ncbi:hypothetical protein [Maribacter ulvicola]|nr:hypothetical protein [Maribacter ulvicola]